VTGALLGALALLILILYNKKIRVKFTYIALHVGNDANEGHFLLLDTLSHQIELVQVGVLSIGTHVAMVCLLLGQQSLTVTTTSTSEILRNFPG
jgi:hypothetical protein